MSVEEQFQLADGEIELCQAMSATDARSWVVSQDRRVWILDADMAANNENRKFFVYAEHESPITAMLTFAADTMVLTGDESGQARLWQAPNMRYSDMLLGCVTKIDSMEMTFALRRHRWNRNAFSVSPDQVQLDDHGGELRVTTTIDRETLEHTLQYKVVSPKE